MLFLANFSQLKGVKMKKKENKIYIIIFDKNNNFKEIRTVNGESNKPFIINSKNLEGDLIYIFTKKDFKDLIEYAMKQYTDPIGSADTTDINKPQFELEVGKGLRYNCTVNGKEGI